MAILSRGLSEGLIARAYRKVLHSYYANDLLIDLRLHAKREAVDYILANMQMAMIRRDRLDLLRFALSRAPEQGMVLEFGVEKGASITCLGKATSRRVHGFDSFRGLPEDWHGTAETRGKFDLKGRLPQVPPNVALHEGWFDETLPRFLAENPEPAAFIHIDCDIYSSTRTVLDLLTPRIGPGTVIVFDEYFNYPGWRQHEYKAFQEFIESTGRTYDYLGYAAEKGHVSVIMK
jgi:predicted O-methyltransferase YrrM